MAIYTIQPHPDTPTKLDYRVDDAFETVYSWSNSEALTHVYHEVMNGLCGIGGTLTEKKLTATDGTEILCYVAETPVSGDFETYWTEYIERLAADDTKYDAMFRDMLKNLGVARIYIQDTPSTPPRIIGATR